MIVNFLCSNSCFII